MRIPLTSGAWLDYDAEWLPTEEADDALASLRRELDWEQREIVLFGRRILQPRLIAWAGDLAYRYSGQTLEARPFTPTARRLLARVSARAGVTFNHVLVNRYRSGDDSMGRTRSWPSCHSARRGDWSSSRGGNRIGSGTTSRLDTGPSS